MQTAVRRGISQRDFAAGYAPICHEIAADNRYGRWLFQLWGWTRRWPFLAEAWRRAVLAEASLPPAAHIHTRVLWDMFTGDEPYRRIARLLISPPSLRALWLGMQQAWRAR
jgi:hypothetical protein